MLSPEEHKVLTSFGRGTPVGELLRRYWQPVGLTDQVKKKPQRLKVLGEELVLYRGDSGKAILMQLRCAHRSVALDYGRVEGDNLRCPYHGWLYDSTGQCIAQPAEPESSSYKDKIRLSAYPTQELGGLVFAYMGPAPAPVLPTYDILLAEDGVKGVQMRNVNANWLNAVENIVDISHLAWLHGHTFPAYGAKKITYHWERKPYGADNVMLIDGIEDTHRSCYGFPNVNRFAGPPVDEGGEIVRSMIWRVPIDDSDTQQFFARYYPSDKRSRHVVRNVVKLGEYKSLEEDWWGIDVSDQDRMAVEQQGRIADRENEHLGVSDGGILLLRRMIRESLQLMAEGRDPIGIIRDPAKAYVDFPQRSTMMVERQEVANYSMGFHKEETVQ